MCVLRLPIPFPDKHSTDVNWAIKKRISISRQSAHISGTGTRKNFYLFIISKQWGDAEIKRELPLRIAFMRGWGSALRSEIEQTRHGAADRLMFADEPRGDRVWATSTCTGRSLPIFVIRQTAFSNTAREHWKKMASKQAWAQTVEDKQTDRSFSLSRVGGEAKNHT